MALSSHLPESKELSTKLMSIAAEGPEVGEEAPVRAVEAQSRKKPS